MPAKLLELHFPLGGLNKAASFQKQPPYTSPSLNNVRPTDTFLGRNRGGSRPGITKTFAAELGSGNPVRLLATVTYVPTGLSLTTIGLASANGTFYKESSGNWASIGGNLKLYASGLVRSAERAQKVYIADYTTVAEGTDGAITGTTTFDSATYADWTAVSGLNQYDFILDNITAATRHRITTVAAGSLTLTDAGSNATGLTFRILRGPKIYDPATNALTLLWPTAGSHPLGCPIIWRFRDRICWAGDPLSPNNVFFSAVGAPLDYDYSVAASTFTRAFSFVASVGGSGNLGDPVTAGFNHSDGCCLIGCTSSLHIVKGDPARNGSVQELSSEIGILGPAAWCRTPAGYTFFMSKDGLYVMAPGCGSTPMAVSRPTIPNDLLAIDPTAYTVQMAYDIVDQGIHLFVTNVSASAGTHYFIAVETESGGGARAAFYPCTYPTSFEPTALFQRRDSSTGLSSVWLGGRDGYVRNHSDSQTTDDGTAITSVVMMGAMGFGGFDGLAKEVVGTLAASSGSVTWSLHVGNTPEAAVAASAFASGTWAAGLNAVARPRGRGGYWCLKLTSTARWGLERIEATIERLGRLRV
mgnify:CR=1 FL=1